MKHKFHRAAKASIYILTLILCFAAASNSKGEEETIDNQVKEIAYLLMCPVCQGQSVAESNSQLANDMRQIIRTKLESGESKEEIIAYFTDRYGDSILGAPPVRGINWLLWLLPALAVAFGGLAIGLFLYKSEANKDEEDPDSKSGGPQDKYMKKIEEDLNKFES